MNPYRTAIGERLALARARLRGWRHRVTVLGLALRATMLVAGATAIGLATGPHALGLPLAIVVPAIAMARPHGGWVWAVELLAVAAWISATIVTAEPSLILAFGIGAAIYVHHAAATLAAVIRSDAAVEFAVLRGWVWRLGIVVAASAVAATATAILAGRPLPVPPQTLAVLASLGALAVPVAIVASLSRR